MNNYTVLHCHTDMSNGVTNVDSVTKYYQYIDKAKELNMKAIAITEHGNIFEYYKKHSYCKSKGIKYIHGIEFYITETTNEKIRDNYHCCLYSKNYKGFLELNKLSSKSFNRKDGHFYYVPRITFEELFNTSENIIISTACIGGVYKSENSELKMNFTNFLNKNKDRCFLEIQHHLDEKQVTHNKLLYEIHKLTGIPMLAATDTHALNETHAKGRRILQEAKDIFFENEDKWDITFKTYEELIEIYKIQDSIPIQDILIAIENTNKLADMVEEFEFDKSHKYPKLYDDSLEVFIKKIREGIQTRGIDKYDNYEEYQKRILDEIETYQKVNAIDYMLLQTKIIEDARKYGGVQQGYGRGSVNGSIIAYLLGITEMDSVKYGLNFFRFLNPSRVTNADIDCDFSEKDREWVRNYLFSMENVKAVDIITFNTIALKGAIRDVGRAFKTFESGKHLIPQEEIDNICKNIETDETKFRELYPTLFEYVDIVNGTIVSIGSHPSGVLVSDLPIDETIGLCTLSGNDNYVTQLSMKPLDELFYVKLDVLGLDSIGIINDTCKLANIPRLTPDNIDLNDEKVWESIKEDTTAIFQMESSMAHKYFKDITRKEVIEKIKLHNPNISMFDLFMFICGAIRPAGENFRDDACNGSMKDNGFKELNKFLHETLSYLLLQEQIMQFLVKFCGYSDAESDNVRRAVAKKGDTTPMLKEIEERFLQYTPTRYDVDIESAKQIIKPFLEDIKSASGYGFSKNHNYPYSITGYAEGWLRYYYPLEFLTTCLNVWSSKEDKMIRVTEYASKKGIKISPPKFGYSSGKYTPNQETNSIYKGIGSIKFCNEQIGEELYELRNNKYESFAELLTDILSKTSIDMRQLEILIKLGFFSTYGGSKKLLSIVNIFTNIYNKKQFKKDNLPKPLTIELIRKHSSKETEKIFKDVDINNLVKELILSIPDEELPLKEVFETELEYVGYISYINKMYNDNVVVVTEVKQNNFGTPFVTLYKLNDGTTTTIKVDKKYFNNKPLSKYDLLCLGDIAEKYKKKKIDGKWISTEDKEFILNSYSLVVE